MEMLGLGMNDGIKAGEEGGRSGHSSNIKIYPGTALPKKSAVNCLITAALPRVPRMGALTSSRTTAGDRELG